MANLPWLVCFLINSMINCNAIVRSRIEKYRPSTLDELVSHKDIIDTSSYLKSI